MNFNFQTIKAGITSLLLLPLWMACNAYAFEPLNTEDAGTVKKNSNQLELYFDMVHDSTPSTGGSQSIVVPGEEFVGKKGDLKFFPFTYTRGIAENAELSIGATYYATPRGNFSPISNNTFAIKWRYFGEDGVGLNLALKPIIQMPVTGSQQAAGFGQAATNYGINFIGSNYWGEDLQLHMNVMYLCSPYNPNYLNGGSAAPLREDIWTISAAPVVKVTERLSLALDVGFQTNPPSNEQYTVMYGMVAAIIKITNDVDLGLSIQRSGSKMNDVMTGHGPNTTRTYGGLTWRFD
jgi:hypothetical protein